MISQHMEALGKYMDLYSSTYENFIFLDDFNTDMEHTWLPTSALYLCNKNTVLSDCQQIYLRSLSIKKYISFIHLLF